MPQVAAFIPDSLSDGVPETQRGRYLLDIAYRELIDSHTLKTLNPKTGKIFLGSHFNTDGTNSFLPHDVALATNPSNQDKVDLGMCGDEWFSATWVDYLRNRLGLNDEAGIAIMTGCSAGNQAIAIGADGIARGNLEWALVGGAELMHPIIFQELSALRVLSYNGCKPFSKGRDGFVLGEGIGLLLLESRKVAEEHGRRVLAQFCGSGHSSDAYHPAKVEPSGEGAYLAMELALEHANCKPAEVGFICASGSGTQTADAAETSAIKRLFLDKIPPVSALKSQVGHSIGGSGALEAIVTVLALNHQVLPPTVGFIPGDPNCDIDYVSDGPRGSSFDVAINNTFALSGNNCTTVMKRGYL